MGAGARQRFWEVQLPVVTNPGLRSAAGSAALPGKEKRYLVQLNFIFAVT